MNAGPVSDKHTGLLDSRPAPDASKFDGPNSAPIIVGLGVTANDIVNSHSVCPTPKNDRDQRTGQPDPISNGPA
jgi:hypothetical protein